MRALHLPAVPSGAEPEFRFPDKPPKLEHLQYTADGFPIPSAPAGAQCVYLIRVLTTAFTRGEITWKEILEPARCHPHGSAVPGHDLVGVVDRVYEPASTTIRKGAKFAPGDRVWGLLDFDRDGAAATYAIALESELSPVPARPAELPQRQWDESIATLPLSGLTAFQALFAHGDLPVSSLTHPTTGRSAHVLITGAAGSVGFPAVQLAKAAGFHVTAFCSAASRGLIANVLDPSDDVIDYTDPSYLSIVASFTTGVRAPVDLVVDCTGGDTLRPVLLDPRSVVKNGGKIVTIVAPIATFGPAVSADMQQACAAANVQTQFFIVKPSGADLDTLGTLVTQGMLRGHADAVFDLEHGRDAMELVESRGRRTGGKVVLRISDDS